MARYKNVIPSRQLCLMIPEDVLGWLQLYLYSEFEGRVPHGAYQQFFMRKIREEKEWERIELGDGSILAGSPEAINRLKGYLV